MSINWQAFIFLSGLLFAFGSWYNRWVAEQEEKGHDRGFMGFIVSFGCLVTLVAGLLIPTWNLTIFLIAFLAFVASGFPMVWGSVQRYHDFLDEQRRKRISDEKARRILLEAGRKRSEGEQVFFEALDNCFGEIARASQLAKLYIENFAYDPAWQRDDNGNVADAVSVMTERAAK